jgi:HPt (histidine-containing phosphotransfer) domain-containing protein
VASLAQVGPGRVADLATAVAAVDRVAIRAQAHAFKSSAGMLGARRLAELLQRLEHAAQTATPDTLGDLLAAIRREYPISEAALQAVVDVQSQARAMSHARA